MATDDRLSGEENNTKIFALYDAMKSAGFVTMFGHDDPDIDCMACVIAMSELLEASGVDVRAFYAGQPTHTQNRVFATKFEFSNYASKMKGASKKEMFGEDGERFSLFLDTHCRFGRGNMVQAGEAISDDSRGPDGVIDHHKGKAPDNCLANIVSVGACSTIVYEFGKVVGHQFSRRARTALLLGIETDTDFLRKEGTTDRDKDAVEELSELTDPQTYIAVINYPKQKSLIDMKGFAFNKENRVEEEGTIVCYGGILPMENESQISNISDELINTDNVQTSCVIAFVPDGDSIYVRVSCRSSSSVLDLDELVKSVFGTDGFGARNGNGGGRAKLGHHLLMFASHCDVSRESICRTMFNAFAKNFITTKNKLS